MRRASTWLLDDRKVLALIGVNTALLFVLSFSQLQGTPRYVLDVIDHGLTAVFVYETLVKIRYHGWVGYWTSWWNRFDFVVIALALPALLADVSGVGAESSVILALRMCRVFKLFRSLHFVPGIERIVAGVGRALRASLVLVIGFSVGLLVVSLISARLFGAIDPVHYGDPMCALYSTFKIFTVEGWFEIPDHIAAQLDPGVAVAARAFFGGVMLVCGVIGLSLLNSVFVDAMVADNSDALERKLDALHDELRALREAIGGTRSRDDA